MFLNDWPLSWILFPNMVLTLTGEPKDKTGCRVRGFGAANRDKCAGAKMQRDFQKLMNENGQIRRAKDPPVHSFPSIYFVPLCCDTLLEDPPLQLVGNAYQARTFANCHFF
jgi:hypothetical protein